MEESTPEHEAQRKEMNGKDGTEWDSDLCGSLYHGSNCCFNSCSITVDHYHCQVCGTSNVEVSQALAHIRGSPGCRKDSSSHYPPCSVAMAADAASSLFNVIYSGFSAQNSYPPASFTGFGQMDSFQWHPASMTDKVAICNNQLSPCCSSNGGTYIPVESQLCSPLSDIYSKAPAPMRDLVTLPSKSSGSTLDSSTWFPTYNPQQIQKPVFKHSDQNSTSQMNFFLTDSVDGKHLDVTSSSMENSNNGNLSTSCSRRTDLKGKDVLKEPFTSFSSQPIPGVLSDDTLFSLQLPEDALKQVEAHHNHTQSSLSTIFMNEVNLPVRTTSDMSGSASSSRSLPHFTQEHFLQYLPSCSTYSPSLEHDNSSGRSQEISHQLSSASSDSDESDIIVEDTGEELGQPMTESEIFIEDIKCSLLQGVVGEEDHGHSGLAESYTHKISTGMGHANKNSKERNAGAILSEGTLKSDIPSFHTILKCVVCENSIANENAGNIFMQMSTQTPLTSISQTPVIEKLNEVVAIDPSDLSDINGKFMCQSCFNLLDTFDSLESKLESLKQNITARIKTCSKQLKVSSPCSKLTGDLIQPSHTSVLNLPQQNKSKDKIISPSVCVEDVQELIQTALVSNPTITIPTSHPEDRDFFLLPGRSLTPVKSVSEVSQLQPIKSVLPEGQTLQSAFDLKLNHLAVATKIPCKAQTPSGSGETHVESETLSQFPEHQLSTADNFSLRDSSVKSCKTALNASALKSTEQSRISESLEIELEDLQPHSSDCTSRNCLELLRLEMQTKERQRKEDISKQQLKFLCDLCGDVFSSGKYLEDHKSMYSKLDPTLCELCGKLNHDQTHLDDHLFFVHSLYQKQCELCGMILFYPCLYNIHIRGHCKEKSIPLAPSDCSGGFEMHCNARGSKENLYLVSPLYFCDKCDQQFTVDSQLEEHVRQKHQEKKSLVKCNKCERTFIKPSDLQAHKRSHSTEKNFECKVCGRRYKSLGNLNHHTKSHETKKPYTCEVCSQGFVRKDFYETHLNSHKDDKPFKCEKCPKTFLSKSYLQAHLKWHMDQTKKVTCPICKKSYSQRLKVHMRSHTGERPHSCQRCAKKFITGSAMRRHMKQVHKENFSTPEECSSDSDPDAYSTSNVLDPSKFTFDRHS